MTQSSAVEVEQVLVVPTSLFHKVGYFQGLCKNVQPYLSALLDPAVISYRPRDQMEQDPSFKQIIPYVVFRHAGQLFQYTRGTAQGEARLHSKRSIGVGGHISTLDQHPVNSPYIEALQRELNEEVILDSVYVDNCVGVLNDDQSEVGRVHLGIVHIFDLTAPQVRPREKSMLNAGFAPLAELAEQVQQFESWSQLCLRELF